MASTLGKKENEGSGKGSLSNFTLLNLDPETACRSRKDVGRAGFQVRAQEMNVPMPLQDQIDVENTLLRLLNVRPLRILSHVYSLRESTDCHT